MKRRRSLPTASRASKCTFIKCVLIIALTRTHPFRADYDHDSKAWIEKYGAEPKLGRRCHGNFYYSVNTSTSVLRKHLEQWHLLEYIIAAFEKSWLPQLHSLVAAIEKGYTLDSLRGLVEDGVDITKLPTRITGDNAGSTDSTDRRVIPKFSKEVFHRFLVEFIVVDDQVCKVFITASLLTDDTCPHPVFECSRVPRISTAPASPSG